MAETAEERVENAATDHDRMVAAYSFFLAQLVAYERLGSNAAERASRRPRLNAARRAAADALLQIERDLWTPS